MEMYFDRNRNEDKPSISSRDEDAKWWETAQDHKFALEVLQLRLRREILKFIRIGPRTEEDIIKKFSINRGMAIYHLALLEKALVVERLGSFYQLTSTGTLFLNNVENNR